MKKITSFFLLCSGADATLLKKCPTETSKYAGMGATIFFTGLFAAFAAGYALYTVFDSAWIAVPLGLIWGLMIFNLDRYIVSSMRKEGNVRRELLSASPRIILALIISVVIARPLELKIFEKEIEPELIIMEQETYARQENELRVRYLPREDSLKREITRLQSGLSETIKKRDELVRIAQEEADGTGGSRRRNLGPIYKAKKADADKAEAELQKFYSEYRDRMSVVERNKAENDSLMLSGIAGLERSRLNGPAARMEALSRISSKSSAISWANWFIMLLFIAIETAPVLVKLISAKGPYDNLLKMEEHVFVAQEIESLARTNAETKERVSALPQHERNFAGDRLDAVLKRS